jgi:glycosyltransferase involved in cell wall biosynthesis
MPRISIVTPVSDRGVDVPRLMRTAKSVAAQVGIEFEYLLVGRDEPNELRALRESTSSGIHWVQGNSSDPQELINTGLRAAQGEFVAWLQPGDVYYRDTLRVVGDAFDEQPRSQVVYGDAVLFDDRDVPRGRFRTKPSIGRRLQSRCCLCQPAVFLRRELIGRHGSLDASLQHWSDYDLWLRLSDAGARFERTPQLLAGCEVPTATGTIHLGPFARDISVEATAELNTLYKRRQGRVPARWLVHAGRVAAAHDPHLRAESVPHFLATLKHARVEAGRHNQSGWAAPAAWLMLPIESAVSEWRRLRRDPHPVKRLLAVDRVSQEVRQSFHEKKAALARQRERIAQQRRALADQITNTYAAGAVRRVKAAFYSVADVYYRASTAIRSTAAAVAEPIRRTAAHCVAQSKRRIFKLKNYEARPLRVPGAYLRTKAPARAPMISVITPNLNQGPFLEATIRSVVDQGYPNTQYIIQDGGSKDESLDVIRRFDKQIAHWASEKDSGQANAINLGMRHATGDIMAYLNSDDILLPGSLAYVAQFFAKHPEIDVVYGHRVLIDEAGSDIGRWVLPPHDDEVLAYVDYVPQETMFWRKSIWEKVGSQLDEAFHFAMDWDLILRFRDAGAKFHRLPRFLGAFRISTDNKTTKLLETVGRRDMEILRKRVLGRIPDDREIHNIIRPYLQRHWLFDKLYLTGVLRY